MLLAYLLVFAVPLVVYVRVLKSLKSLQLSLQKDMDLILSRLDNQMDELSLVKKDAIRMNDRLRDIKILIDKKPDLDLGPITGRIDAIEEESKKTLTLLKNIKRNKAK